MRKFIAIFLVCAAIFSAKAQKKVADSPYEVNEKLEIPLALTGAGLTMFGFYRLNQKSPSDPETVQSLVFEEEIIKFNRHGQPRYSEQANKDSDILFFGSMPLPFLMLFDDNIRKGVGRISIMYVEALALTGIAFTMTASNVDKFRPLVYSDEAPMSERVDKKSKNSFYGGHPTITATSMFFVAKVVSDYYPDRKGLHFALYSAASVATLANAYLRFRAGKHFLTDLMVGIPIGALNGILVPALHKVRHVNMDKKLSWSLFTGNVHGVTLNYKIR